jgi:hypothetical protein
MAAAAAMASADVTAASMPNHMPTPSPPPAPPPLQQPQQHLMADLRQNSEPQGSTLTMLQVLRVCTDVAAGLAYLHSQSLDTDGSTGMLPDNSIGLQNSSSRKETRIVHRGERSLPSFVACACFNQEGRLCCCGCGFRAPTSMNRT